MLPSYELSVVRARTAHLPTVADSVEPGRRAAVAAVLREGASGVGAELLLIRRAEHPHDPWSGHIAMPGGRRDEGDADLAFTAVRETREEVGLDLDAQGTLLTRLPDLPAEIRGRPVGLVIASFVFALGAPGAVLALNHEVAESLWVPLGALARGEGAGTFEYVYAGQRLELPCVRIGEHVLWGLTYEIVQRLLRAVHTP